MGDATTDHTVVPDGAPLDALSEASEDVTEEPAANADTGIDASPDASDGGNCPIDPVSGEPTELRCTGLYSDWDTRTVASGITQFAPGYVLWSDGAVKTRWIYLPPGQKIDTSNMDEWLFPVETRFWKQFVVNGVFIETRMLHKKPAPTGATWTMVTYQWAADLSRATMLSVGAVNVNDAGNPAAGYEIPSADKCVKCHQGRVDSVLGFEAVSLAGARASGLTMADLIANDLITNPPSTSLTVPGNAVESEALGYLHANCGTICHNPNRGLASTSGFFMRLNAGQLASVTTTDTYTTGWGKPTKTTQFVSQGVSERIVACNPQASCAYFRPSHRDGVDAPTGTQMPPIDTHAVDPNGLAKIAAWINEGCADGGAEAGLDGGSD
jgi:hypothetical protein